MGTDHRAEAGDPDLAQIGAGFAQGVPDFFRVLQAVRVQDMNRQPGCADLFQVIQDTGGNGLERRLTPPRLLDNIERRPARVESAAPSRVHVSRR